MARRAERLLVIYSRMTCSLGSTRDMTTLRGPQTLGVDVTKVCRLEKQCEAGGDEFVLLSLDTHEGPTESVVERFRLSRAAQQ